MEALHHWHIGNVVRRSTAQNITALAQASHNAPTIPQATLLLLWISAILLLIFRSLYRQRIKQANLLDESDLESSAIDSEHEQLEDDKRIQSRNSQPHRKDAGSVMTRDGVVINGMATTEITIHNIEPDSTQQDDKFGFESNDTKIINPTGGTKATTQLIQDSLSSGNPITSSIKLKQDEAPKAPTFSKVPPPPTFDQFLWYCAMFGLIMMLFYVCDYKHKFAEGTREYSRDLFMFLVLLLFAVAGLFTVQTTEDKILNRDQTEEWKGWMQVMFVWYHYFMAKETYNYIRIFIACYVWMTGFGNFSFFWVRKDFSLWRILKMLFRLNFLVVMTLLVTDNSYMLYYICAMHTYWFLSVYAFMGIFPSWNEDRLKMAFKFVCYFVINAAVFDTPLRDVIFKPFWFIMSYEGSMHEWLFRAGLDHYATFVGMVCAYNYPHFERFINYLDKRHLNHRDYMTTVLIKFFLSGLLLVILGIWYDGVMLRVKYDYNKYHPYTSWIPILIYIFFRNIVPSLRTRYLGLFAFLGKITLETYIAQLHIYMQYNAHKLIVFIPGYPLMNFALASIIYLFISHRLFHLTMDFSAFILPRDNMKKVVLNGIMGIVVVGLHLCFALLCREVRLI
ncbi:protein REDUCED WALL ACETYLATION 2-like [Asterias rubens]|uniref:protein REDUCED WALL ACETYLATION 2-like n=1 Tax=Asterias rubens TaxID=7604 RepID=UPI0014550539|nr:protein REDUCED WALL ACETYLATION 2-like [Asterias rubens]XP_033640739.1 protein REDUCED WALL ACETYLATION 2-like [Asterias rubens]